MNSVPLLFFYVRKRRDANQIYCRMHPLYGDKCFMKSIVHVWCKKMLVGQKFASDTEVQSVVCHWFEQQPASFFAMDIQKLFDIRDKCITNSDDMLKK